MNRLRLTRWLQITWTVCCGIAVLFVALWVRSYWCADYLDGPLLVGSMQGKLTFIKMNEPSPWKVVKLPLSSMPPAGSTSSWGYTTNFRSSAVHFPHWLLVAILAIIAAMPWLRFSKRFSLRTLLIAMTLVSVVLGVVVYLINPR